MADSRDSMATEDGARADRRSAAQLSRSDRRRAKAALKHAKRAERARAKRAKAARGRGGRLRSDSYPGPLVLRDARSAQEALGYELLYEDGTVLVEEGTYSRVVRFSDINFLSARPEEQERAFEQWRAAWNEVDPTVKAQVKIVCRVVDKERFLGEMLLPPVEGDDVGNPFREELNSIIERRVAMTRQNVERSSYIVFTVRDQESRADAETALAHTIESATRNLLGMGVETVSMLDGDELLALVDSITNPSDDRGEVTFDALRARDRKGRSATLLGYTTKDLVAPTDVSRPDPTHVTWGDCYGQALYVQTWGNSVRGDILATLSELPVNQVITLDVTPWDPVNAIEMVEGVSTDLKAQRTEFVLDHSQTMYVTDEMLPTPLRDALQNVAALRDDLVNGDELFFSFSMSALTWGSDREECDKSARLIRETLRRFSYRMVPLHRLQGQGFAAALPTGRYDIPYSRSMTSSQVAAFMPFSSVEILDPHGMYMGQNRISKNFIFYDRAKAVSPNGFILGQLGRGKSVTAKSTILWTRLTDPDADIMIIDPEDEYPPLVEALGGQRVRVGAGATTNFNPLDLALDDDEGAEAQLELKTDMVISTIVMMAKHVSELQKSVVDRCVKLIYARYLETKDPADIPVLSDLWVELKSQPEQEARDLAVTIERYIVGQAALFNHRTNVDVGPDQHLVSFDIRDNGANMKPLVELFVLDFIWQRVVRNRALHRRTWIFIDEIHLLFDSEYSVDYFDALWSRSRKYGAIPTGITQNAERLLENPKTRKMISNSDFLVLLGQSSTDARTIGAERGLSDDQVAFLERTTPGSGIIVAGGRVVEFENVIPSDTRIYQLLNTKPDE